jgi:hypothetical protein
MNQATSQILRDDEPTLGMAAAGRKCPGHPAHHATVARWIMSGCRSASGERVYLEGVRRGYKWFTSEQALVRFFDRLSARPTTAVSPPAPTDRRTAAEAAARELEAAGA